ncbi:photosystem II reaction center Psb28 protein [Striga asiatica]|uniref:Photosystem II reaction center Psb28 protein n=1 Tax=Striga asiatica TaxID=4170 RepID=A0A5A7NXH5_STRAF|nr:photosystem II reaction center Psb28 protein [Striga asiatica]
MATLQSLAFSSPISRCSQQPRCKPGFSIAGAIHSSGTSSSFNGQSLTLPRPSQRSRKQSQPHKKSTPRVVMMVKPTIQFIQGMDEQTVPDVRLTKSRDGTNGMAIFSFTEPSVFDSSSVVGDITGFYMIDEEGVLQSVDVNAKFVNGKPAGIEAKYVMRTPREWDRFMRFMERYANANGLSFVKK